MDGECVCGVGRRKGAVDRSVQRGPARTWCEMRLPEVAVYVVDPCAGSWGRARMEKGAREMHVDAAEVVGKEQAAGRAWKRTKTCESLSQRHTVGSAMHGSIVQCERKRENGATRPSCGRQSGLARLAPQPNFTDGTANAVPNVHLHPQTPGGARACTNTAGEGDETRSRLDREFLYVSNRLVVVCNLFND